MSNFGNSTTVGKFTKLKLTELKHALIETDNSGNTFKSALNPEIILESDNVEFKTDSTFENFPHVYTDLTWDITDSATNIELTPEIFKKGLYTVNNFTNNNDINILLPESTEFGILNNHIYSCVFVYEANGFNSTTKRVTIFAKGSDSFYSFGISKVVMTTVNDSITILMSSGFVPLGITPFLSLLGNHDIKTQISINGASQSLSNGSFDVVVMDTTDFEDNDELISVNLTNNTLTTGYTSDNFNITYHVSITSSSGGSSEVEVKLEKNEGAGWIDVPHSDTLFLTRNGITTSAFYTTYSVMLEPTHIIRLSVKASSANHTLIEALLRIDSKF